MLFSEHEKIQEKNSQHLGAFKLWINVIHRMLYSLFRISLSHSPLWLLTSVVERHLLPGSSTPIYLSRRNIPYLYCPERRKIMEVKKSYKTSLLKGLAK